MPSKGNDSSAARAVNAGSMLDGTGDKRVEVKMEKTYWGITIPATNYSMRPFATINAGDNSNERTGRAIRLLESGYRVEINSQAEFNSARIIVFKWKATTAPIDADIVTGSTGASTATYNIQRADKYEILSDKLYVVNGGAKSILLPGTMNPGAVFDEVNLKTVWEESYLDNNAITRDHVYAIILAGPAQISVNGYTYTRYVDV